MKKIKDCKKCKFLQNEKCKNTQSSRYNEYSENISDECNDLVLDYGTKTNKKLREFVK